MSQLNTSIFNESSLAMLSEQIPINDQNNNEKYICELCNFRSVYKSALVRHIKYSCKNNQNKKEIRPDKKFTQKNSFPNKEQGQSLKDAQSSIPTNTAKLIQAKNMIDFILSNESYIDPIMENTFIERNVMCPVAAEENIEPITNEDMKKHVHNFLHNFQVTEKPLKNLSIPSVSNNDSLMLRILLQNQEQQHKQHNELMGQNNELMEQLKKTVEQCNKPINIEKGYFNIEKIQIFMTDPIDFVDVLTKRYGCREKAINHIKNRIYEKKEGDITLFCDIYLNGEPDTWPISCLNRKNRTYKIAQPNNEAINDPGGIQIHKNFRVAYANTLLRLCNEEVFKTLKQDTESHDYEKQRDFMLDEFDLSLFQDKAEALYINNPCDPFIKKLTERFRIIEESNKLFKVVK